MRITVAEATAGVDIVGYSPLHLMPSRLRAHQPLPVVRSTGVPEVTVVHSSRHRAGGGARARPAAALT